MIQLQMPRLPPARGRGQPAASPRPPLAHAVVLAAAAGIAIAAFAAAAADATTYAHADLLPPIPPLIPAAHAAVSATSVGHETTTIVEFANSGPDTVRAFRMWLSGEAAFKSFKTEKGWTGTRLPQGVLVFTSAAGGAGVEPGQAVKFGIKTDTESPAVNWRALDSDGEDLALDVTSASGPPSRIVLEARAAAAARQAEAEQAEAERLAEEQRLAEERQRIEDERARLEAERRQQEELAAQPPPPPPPPQNGVLAGSEFRLVPETPHIDATVRVVGEGFGAGQPLTLHMDGSQLAQFASDQSGRFVVTATIPPGTPADRASFAVRDAQGGERTYSVRLIEVPGGQRVDEQASPLVVTETPGTVSIEGAIMFRGTGEPGTSITITITDERGSPVTTQRAQVGPDGGWSYGLLMPSSAGVGNYTAAITDGTSSVDHTWQVADDARITLESAKGRFEPGEALRFSGRASPGKDVTAIIENPRGVEIYSESVNVSASGGFSFGMSTTIDNIEGTYVAFAFQGDDSATAHAGLGEPPKPRLAVRPNSLNYQPGQLAVFAVDGPPGATVTLSVLEDKEEKFTSVGVLNSAGRYEYPLDLLGYASGVYTVVVSHATAQASSLFSVGLAEGSGQLTVQTTKEKYSQGEALLILGTVESSDRVLVTLMLIDPDGRIVSTKPVITDKAEKAEDPGRLSVDTLRVPSNAAAGMWAVRAESGPNFASTAFEVVGKGGGDGIVLLIEDIEDMVITGRETVHFRVIGATDHIVVRVFSSGGDEVGDEIRPPGRHQDYPSYWHVPEHLEHGEYTMVATAGRQSANATFAYPPAR